MAVPVRCWFLNDPDPHGLMTISLFMGEGVSLRSIHAVERKNLRLRLPHNVLCGPPVVTIRMTRPASSLPPDHLWRSSPGTADAVERRCAAVRGRPRPVGLFSDGTGMERILSAVFPRLNTPQRISTPFPPHNTLVVTCAAHSGDR